MQTNEEILAVLESWTPAPINHPKLGLAQFVGSEENARLIVEFLSAWLEKYNAAWNHYNLNLAVGSSEFFASDVFQRLEYVPLGPKAQAAPTPPPAPKPVFKPNQYVNGRKNHAIQGKESVSQIAKALDQMNRDLRTPKPIVSNEKEVDGLRIIPADATPEMIREGGYSAAELKHFIQRKKTSGYIR